MANQSAVSLLQTVERERGTIKQSMMELRDNKGARRSSMSQGSGLHKRGYAAWINMEVTVPVTVHDKMSELRRKGVSDG